MECLQRNLASFGLELESVPGNGHCCFISIVKETSKLMISNGENNAEFRRHLDRLGFQASLNEDTKLLRSLFCQEIEENIEQYRNFVDFDINEELSKFSVSGCFYSSLGDLCVLACSNLLQTSIVLITSIPGTPCIPFVPSTICNKMAILIAYNHSGPGHYDATRAEEHCVYRCNDIDFFQILVSFPP